MGSITPAFHQDEVEDFDLIVIGAGISGINCSYRLQTELPQLKFAVLEGRQDIGGTWDLFKYPGIRSDSDLFTFGFPWHPWPHSHPIAEGPLVKSYMKHCVDLYGLDKYINLSHRVMSADWRSKLQKWTLSVDNEGRMKRYTTTFIVLGAGYYDYNKPLDTDIPGLQDFQGKVIHPQFWPEDYDYADKKMVIIGSGATAITLLPSLADRAAHVTMLQRSPSYILSLPNRAMEPRSRFLGKLLPKRVLGIIKWCSFVVFAHQFAFMSRWFPSRVRATLRRLAIAQLPAEMDVDVHFKPVYNPWDQRVCFAPDGDFYKVLHTPKADVVTGKIKRITEHGIQLEDGDTISADVIITATGLRMLFGGEIPLTIDGERVTPSEKMLWNGAMVQDVPNLFFMLGYTNASWTLGADDTARIICRLYRFMEKRGVYVAVPRTAREFTTKTQSSWQLSSTYAKAAQHRLPKYGFTGPWKPRGDIVADHVHSRWGNITNGLHFAA